MTAPPRSRDGVALAAAEEERFSRIKHAKRPVPFSAWELPFNAIDYCLGEAGITLAEVDHVAYSFDPDCFPAKGEINGGGEGAWASPWDPLFVSYVRNAPQQLVDGVPHHLRRRLAVGGEAPRLRWHFVRCRA